ncbi:MAG: DNA polymerase III subunit delta [Candidatus Saccharibacteria bacterium]
MILAFIGDNGPAREQAAGVFTKAFVSLHGSTAVDKFNGDDLEKHQLIDAISTSPFLSTRRLVIVRDLNSSKTLAEDITSICESVSDTTDLVLIEKHIDSRGKYLNNLKKIAEVREFTHLEGEALTEWVIEQANSLGGKISYKLAQSLVDRVGTNHQLLVSELQKLILYDKIISQENIELLTTYIPQSSVFAMLDAAFDSNTSKALKLYKEQRAQGMEPQAILGMIAWQLNILAIVKTAGDLPPNDIASQAKISPFVVRKNQNNAKRITTRQLAGLLEQAIKTDMMIKTTNVKPDDALQSLIMAFA